MRHVYETVDRADLMSPKLIEDFCGTEFVLVTVIVVHGNHNGFKYQYIFRKEVS